MKLIIDQCTPFPVRSVFLSPQQYLLRICRIIVSEIHQKPKQKLPVSSRKDLIGTTGVRPCADADQFIGIEKMQAERQTTAIRTKGRIAADIGEKQG